MDKFVFVILHYKTEKDTIECIESIKKLSYKNIEIVIVDNGSQNGTGENLKNLYKTSKNIYVIIEKKNWGFAQGNNIGFKYAKYELKADYICVLNNDTIINQYDFVETSIRFYLEEKYYIAGPDVISLIDGGHQSPFGFHLTSKKAAIKDIIFNYIKLISFYLHVDKQFSEFISKRRKKNKCIYEKTIIEKKCDLKDDIGMLNGCCIIFSKLYIENYDGFYPKTFMYGEESILFILCKELGMKMLYLPEIKIIHKEGSSTKYSHRNRKKEIFFYKHSIKSSKLVLKLIKKRNNKTYLESQLKFNNK